MWRKLGSCDYRLSDISWNYLPRCVFGWMGVIVFVTSTLGAVYQIITSHRPDRHMQEWIVNLGWRFPDFVSSSKRWLPTSTCWRLTRIWNDNGACYCSLGPGWRSSILGRNVSMAGNSSLQLSSHVISSSTHAPVLVHGSLLMPRVNMSLKKNNVLPRYLVTHRCT